MTSLLEASGTNSDRSTAMFMLCMSNGQLKHQRQRKAPMFNWLKKTNASGTDFTGFNSREKAEAATRRGVLVPMMLMPEEFGGSADGGNVVFVPAFAAEMKTRIDVGTVFPLALNGKITQYSAYPTYKGESFVPSSITVHAHQPSDFTATIEIW
jgi:hypothetical protein